MRLMHPEPSAAVAAFLKGRHGAFIDGQIVSDGDVGLPVYDPATGNVIAQVATSHEALVQRAVDSAHAAFSERRWRGVRPADRERILLRFADLVERDAEFLAELETREQGKSIGISRQVEVNGTIDWMRYAAGLATKITGMTMDLSIPTPPGTRSTAMTRREPIGVVAGIVPWNFPLTIAAWKIMPALAAGCTIVLKPSELTPLTALYLAGLASEAGVPNGVFNIVTGDANTGRALVASPKVAKISFTGSTRAGVEIGISAMKRLARVTLELGGKNPAIVLDDADPVATAAGLIAGGFFNGGQVCAAASRLYVTPGIFDRLGAELQSAVSSLTIGSGLDLSAHVGPLVSSSHRDKVASYISEAEGAGAKLIRGGQTPGNGGYFVSPALVVNPEPQLRLLSEEIFGPVLAMVRVADAEEALRLANDTPYGLAASVWTQNLKQAMDLTDRIEAGTVWVNTHVPIDPAMPFGGYKASGLGRDFGTQWAEAYTEEKSICFVA